MFTGDIRDYGLRSQCFLRNAFTRRQHVEFIDTVAGRVIVIDRT